mmetsp:Transcript_2944/g.5173  ORF Transcript_2944/g.5173 Transcript_2944/m.5173 type:complete len:141 (-) Transcript_2944:315-737(-)
MRSQSSKSKSRSKSKSKLDQEIGETVGTGTVEGAEAGVEATSAAIELPAGEKTPTTIMQVPDVEREYKRKASQDYKPADETNAAVDDAAKNAFADKFKMFAQNAENDVEVYKRQISSKPSIDPEEASKTKKTKKKTAVPA